MEAVVERWKTSGDKDPTCATMKLTGAEFASAAISGQPVFGDLKALRKKGVRHLFICPGDDPKDDLAFSLLRFLFKEDPSFRGPIWEALGCDFMQYFSEVHHCLVIEFLETPTA